MDSYYKLHATAFLLQSATRFITSCDRYYKVRDIFQIAMVAPPPPSQSLDPALLQIGGKWGI